jgi:hypothetical protein
MKLGREDPKAGLTTGSVTNMLEARFEDSLQLVPARGRNAPIHVS